MATKTEATRETRTDSSAPGMRNQGLVSGQAHEFAITYDGGFEQYIKDFATLVPDLIDNEFQDCEGYPGVRSPQIWNYIAQYQSEAIVFYSAYPNVTVKQVWKGQRVLKAFEELLDEASS